MRDLHNNIKTSQALAAQSITTNTTTVGSTIDRAGYDALEFSIQAATLTDGTYTPALYEGNESNMSDETVVTDTDDLLGTVANATFAATDDNVCKRIGYRGTKRYVRLKIVSAGTTSGGALSATAIQAFPVNAPTPA